MKDLAIIALDTARIKGATYADIRIGEKRGEDIEVRNGEIATLDESESIGFGVRVILNGCWGFAASSKVTKDEIERITKRACEEAMASSMLKKEDIRLSKEEAYQTTWHTPFIIDPFSVPITEKLDLLFRIDEILRKDARIAVSEASMGFMRERQILATSEGSFIEQTLLRSGGGYSATAVKDGDVQKRSYPMSFGGQYLGMGYEVIRSLDLLENSEKTREEAVALLSAKPCQAGRKDLIIDGTQLALQIHESAGHPSELDRVMGLEENYAGRSFLTTEKYKRFRYGSGLVNLVADSTLPTGLSTFGFDDDGVRAKRWHIVKDGTFVGYHTNREFAHIIGDGGSRGCNRADGWSSLPMIRITNLSLMPGNWDFKDLIADTEDGLLFCTNKSWSIDQLRYNFQFATEIGWEIKDGKLGDVVKNCTYQGITPEFWASCDAICNLDYWRPWGVVNCGKGQPGQVAEMSHGAAPARFRNVTVGVAT